VFWAFIFLMIGLFFLISPRKAWYVVIGWQIKNAEPTDGAIKIYRLIGLFLVVTRILKFIGLNYSPILN
jgi:hypothetical protein